MRLRQFRVTAFFTGLVLSAAFFALLLLAFASSTPARDLSTSSERAVPGTLNYVEGEVAIGSEAINSRSIGTAQIQDGQSLSTRNGKAEILLTPGVFLRIGDNSTVAMISSSLTNTQVGLDRGHAIVEVDEIYPENDIRVVADGISTELLKTGLYDFDLDAQPELRVFDGKAGVFLSDNRQVEVKGGHELSLEAMPAGAKAKTTKFDKKAYDATDLYRWSSLRSAYVAEANVNAAGSYYNSGWGPWGPGWWGAGWYWDPWFYGYTFIPGDGIFYSPFGWGFYSPWWVYRAPFYGAYGFRGGIYHHFSADYRSWGPGGHYVAGAHYAHGVYSGAGSAGAFHSGARSGGAIGGGAHGGGFGGGGFHGGGFGGGGFHGGGGGHGR